MLNLHTAQIESLSVHRVGNKSRNEGIFISEEAYPVNDELHALLKEYFLKPFRDKEENFYQFVFVWCFYVSHKCPDCSRG